MSSEDVKARQKWNSEVDLIFEGILILPESEDFIINTDVLSSHLIPLFTFELFSKIWDHLISKKSIIGKSQELGRAFIIVKC